jgi:hypothetical protein
LSDLGLSSSEITQLLADGVVVGHPVAG